MQAITLCTLYQPEYSKVVKQLLDEFMTRASPDVSEDLATKLIKKCLDVVSLMNKSQGTAAQFER